MARLVSASLLLVLVSLVPACATGGGGGGADSEYTATLGRQLFNPLQEAMDKILLQQHGYRINQEREQYGSLYYETLWEEREPTSAERDQGITRLRHRVIVRARRSSDDPSTGGALYRVTFVAENQARSDMESTWHPAPLSEEFEGQMRRIVSDLNLELRAGVRR